MIMDLNQLGLILWVAAGTLMAAAIVGVALATLLGKAKPVPAEPPQVVAERVPAEPVDEEVLSSRKAAYRLGLWVLVGLAVLTALEFAAASLLEGSTVLLFVIALVKAGVIIQYYMHLNNVWGTEEAH
jgi:small-conductance mechanosensitive channel